jgi:uncharacterized protein
MNENIPIPAAPPMVAVAVPAKPRVWTVFVAFGVLLVLEVIATIVIVLVITIAQYGVHLTPAKIGDAAISAPGILSSILCTMAIAAGITLAGTWLSPVHWRNRLSLFRVPLRLPVLVMGTLCVMSAGMILTACITLGWVPRSPALDMLTRMIKSLSLSRTIMTGLLLGLLPGMIEELLFRGYIQTRLVARWGAMWGVFWTALMFGIMHLDLMQGLFAVAVGCVLGFITVRTGSIVPAMICHASNNIISTLIACDIQGRTNNFALLFLGLIIMPLAIFYLHRRLPPVQAPTAARTEPQ